jgi:hypothetical protein
MSFPNIVPNSQVGCPQLLYVFFFSEGGSACPSANTTPRQRHWPVPAGMAGIQFHVCFICFWPSLTHPQQRSVSMRFRMQATAGPHTSHCATDPQEPTGITHHTAAGHTTKLRRLACSYSSMSKRFSSASCAYALSLPSPPPQVNRGGFRCRTSGRLAYFASASFQTRAQVSLRMEPK